MRSRTGGARPAVPVLILTLLASSASAEPTGPSVVCATYPELPDCAGSVPSCALCHESTDPPSWNAFGTTLKAQMTSGVAFDAALVASLKASADDDSDGDGQSNLEELRAGRSPSTAEAEAPMSGGSLPNPRYRIGAYDPAFALRRVSTLYCGHSPSYEEMEALGADGASLTVQQERVHEALERCVRSEYWLKEGLLRLADKRIRPVRAFGKETDIVIGEVRVVIGDYDYDYNLWRHALSDDRDMREMLTAEYHLVAAADGTLQKVEGPIEKPDPQAVAGGQPVPTERRAGLLTTQWFLAYHTMFSPLPRVTAAQAYRAYLGTDIAANEGLRPVAGEPVDVDKKGVDDPRCATCHSTLDPLSYAFAEYEGVSINLSMAFGAYAPERPAARIPEWNATRKQSVLLGKTVNNLVEWARVAADSDEFKRTMAEMFFHHALGRGPLPEERAELESLWRSAAEDGHSANRMLHRLVDTRAFGSP